MSLSQIKEPNSTNKSLRLSLKSEGNVESEPLISSIPVKNSETTESTESRPEIDRLESELKHSSDRFRKPKKSSVSPDNSHAEVAIPFARRKRLTFENIEASTVKKGGERHEILKKVSGTARPGELTFIMGSSGAGKTTLLNILTGRNLRKIETHGDVFVNGRSMQPNEMKKLSAYVQQDDVFIGMLTVKETLHFAAKLRSPKNLTDIERDEVVDELLVMMSLKKCENTKVGSMTEKSLSRGERKRLAFACEILTDPPILFCDEPTSGLDAFMSHQVIKALRQLTTEGKTVICTIHQPSTSVYHMADSLILLSQGHVIYNGSAKKVDEFFERCGYAIPKFVSTPDHFMKVISHKHHESEEEYNGRIDRILKEYQVGIMSNSSSRSSRREESELETNSFPRGWWSQFYFMLGRSVKQVVREKSLIVVKLIQTAIMALVVGGVYFGLPIHRDHLLSFKGFAFLSVQMMHMLFLTPAMTIFWRDYPVVVREYQANMYCPSAYFLAKSTIDSLQYGVYPIIFGVMVLYMTNLPTDAMIVFHYFTIMVLLSFNSTALSHGVASVTGNLATGFTVMPVLAIPFMVFGGFLISYDAIPWYFSPLAYLSWYKYAFEGITIAFFRNVGPIPGCEESSGATACSTGPGFIADQDFDVANLWLDYFALFVSITFWKVVGIFAFSRRIRKA